MAKIEGIIYKAFQNYVVLRGFAPIGDIAEISKKSDSYQREPDNQHMIDIVNYLDELKAYFPEITLACRAEDYQGFVASIGADDDISGADGAFVKGLKVLSERLPVGRDRARHAYLELNRPTEEDKLIRVDGNHRLQPFTQDLKWWYQFIKITEDIENEPDEDKKEGWMRHEAELFKKKIESKKVPFTIVISDAHDADNFEAKIFHDVNFKQMPLREEASLRIISELKTFEDKEKLGAEYPLTLEIIEKAKINMFGNIHWLKVNNNISKDYYRTACLRIVRLLETRRKYAQERIEAYNRYIASSEEILFKKEKEIDGYKDTQIEYPKDKDGNILYENNLDENQSRKLFLQSEIEDINKDIEYRKTMALQLGEFLTNSGSADKITEAIYSLRTTYGEFEEGKHGNISMLAALVYYKMFNKHKFTSFTGWIKRNGINGITTIDDLPIHTSDALVDMFEKIYEAKRNEIFISMQFGDDQSEMIYEKTIQAIEKFKKNYGYVKIKPVRIDKNIAPHAFTISDEIMKAIKNCSLVIADLSSGNKNVYHEIGYAMGVAEAEGIKPPPVILLYKTLSAHRDKTKYSEYNFIGFNLRGLSQLRFSNYEELQTGLMERLKKHFEI